jgi:tetratricopeptide (TPR) repeat protein
MRNETLDKADSSSINGARVAFFGRLSGMTRREAARLIHELGGRVTRQTDEDLTLLVVGEQQTLVSQLDSIYRTFAGRLQDKAKCGLLEVITESDLWQRIKQVEPQPGINRLYTPAMLAELVGVPISVIRRWHRKRLIEPVRELHRLPYFDFQEVATARALAEMLAAGLSHTTIERKMTHLANFLPHVQRPLAQLAVIVQGKDVLLRRGAGLLDDHGQYRFDFQIDEQAQAGGQRADEIQAHTVPFRAPHEPPPNLEQLLETAESCEDRGELDKSIEAYRAVLAMGGPNPEVCFRMAEILYSLGDAPAARERYYMAIELDEDFVEARFGLACLLADLEQFQLAVAAFEGTLAHHPDYADAHYHLAQTLDEMGRCEEAADHWRAFIQGAPHSPWVAEAEVRLSKCEARLAQDRGASEP